MAITLYSYVKLCDTQRLVSEIAASAIITALDRIETNSTNTDIYFKDELSDGDEILLDGIVENHVNEPLPENTVTPVSLVGPKDVLGYPINTAYVQPFANKKLPDGKSLFARNTGLQVALNSGSNTIDYIINYPHVKIIGIEVINCEALDTAEMKVYDSSTGTYSGVPNLLFNQFGYTLNLPDGYYKRESPFDADVYLGMKLEFTYVSVSAKTIGVNIIMNEVKS